MPEFKIVFARSARKELQALSQTIVSRIIDKIELLALNPRPKGCKKLRGHSNLWRIRVGDYRVVYSVDDKNQIVDVSVIRNRDEAYR